MEHKLVDGVKIPLTAQEILNRQNEEVIWQQGSFDRALSSLRQRRNALLTSSDWTVLSDSPLTTTEKTAWKSYRQSLRDITENITTVEQVNQIVFPTKP